MSKISNTLLMLNILQNGQIIKIKELAEMLECSERSVRTYKDDLEKAGIFIESIPGKYGGYYYSCGLKNNYFILDKNDLNTLENLYLYLINNKYDNIISLNNIIEKIRFHIISSHKQSDSVDLKNNSNYLLLSDAINNNKKINFVYKKKDVIFIPQNIYINDGNCYVTGINKKINQIRTYNISDLKNLQII